MGLQMEDEYDNYEKNEKKTISNWDVLEAMLQHDDLR